MKKNSIENQKRRPNLIRLVGRDGRQTRPLDFFKLNCFLRKNNVFKGLKKLQEAYNYFLYKQIVKIVLKN